MRAARVPGWGVDAAYRDPGRGEGWLASALAAARAARAADVARYAQGPQGTAARAAAEEVRTALAGIWGLADLQRRVQGCGESEAGR